MWDRIARFVFQFRLYLLALLVAATAFMGYHASKVQLSYDFTRAIPTDNPKYVVYEAFRQKFGEDGNLLVIGLQTDQLFKQGVFNDFTAFNSQLKSVAG